ncbi:hypothetical protein ANACOL_04006 [Anaerotruncus colihominis DSM 17241]|uniref:Uncharacterized protein n=1 Tax=Anaerotruncus colihominis DSM 17241 TaxID=445972 RepID=B0PGY5_9FIRM|nr:hypothetical protein ANACOL_04006 [Anaerotruncus colihominis DSM 17241]
MAPRSIQRLFSLTLSQIAQHGKQYMKRAGAGPARFYLEPEFTAAKRRSDGSFACAAR